MIIVISEERTTETDENGKDIFRYRVNRERRNSYSISRMLENNLKHSKNTQIVFADVLNEGTSFTPADREKSGIITFPCEADAIDLNKLNNWIKQKLSAINNKIKADDEIGNTYNPVGWTVGRYLSGKYTANNGITYGEDSLSVELIGIDPEKVISVAEELCVSFQQESALVKI